MNQHVGTFHIGGQWISPLSETTTPVIEAATEQPLGQIAEAGPKDVDRAVAAARAAQRGWAATTPADRAESMERLADAVERRSDEISRTVSRQNGMPLALSVVANVVSLAGTLRYYAALARAGLGDQERPALSYQG